MRWPDPLTPVRMSRIALVAPADRLRDALVQVADAGLVQLDDSDRHDDVATGAAAQRLRRLSATDVAPRLSAIAPDLDALEREGRTALLAGEAQLEQYSAGAVTRMDVSAVAGWCPHPEVEALEQRLEPIGVAVVVLPIPPGRQPPTLLSTTHASSGSLAPLVKTYGTVPYRDIDPTIPAGISYAVMFGMMFGDVGHGVLLVLAALFLRSRRTGRLAALSHLWLFGAGAGLAATVFGALYGECFGPTLPVLWLAPLDNPMELLATAVAVGAVFLAGAYAIGIINRWREGGVQLALYASSGIAGATLFLGCAGVAGGVLLGQPVLAVTGAMVGLAGLTLAVIGLRAESGSGAAGIAQTAVGAFDLVVRLGSNVVSFARLAAFGMTHAALGWVVWHATTAAAGRGVLGVAVAILVFVLGNTVTFALEALVAGVQALRLEFYELFSRVFVDEGNPFHPWRIPLITPEGASC